MCQYSKIITHTSIKFNIISTAPNHNSSYLKWLYIVR